MLYSSIDKAYIKIINCCEVLLSSSFFLSCFVCFVFVVDFLWGFCVCVCVVFVCLCLFSGGVGCSDSNLPIEQY